MLNEFRSTHITGEVNLYNNNSRLLFTDQFKSKDQNEIIIFLNSKHLKKENNTLLHLIRANISDKSVFVEHFYNEIAFQHVTSVNLRKLCNCHVFSITSIVSCS